MKKIIAFVSVFLAAVSVSFSQSITTANDFFKNISDYYSTLSDYEAGVDITIGKTEMKGALSWKAPGMLRIDFTDPEEQCINFNGDLLQIYLPEYSAILEQSVTGTNQSAQGLGLLRRYYTIQYETGQSAVPLEEGSDQMVVNIICYRRSSTEAFRSVRLSIDPDTKLIVRVEAVSSQGENYIIDFYNYHLNTGISDQRFVYDPPSSANNYSNFLFEE